MYFRVDNNCRIYNIKILHQNPAVCMQEKLMLKTTGVSSG